MLRPEVIQTGVPPLTALHPVGIHPFEETAQNKGVADYVKYTGKDKIAGLGVYAWAAGIELQQALQSVVKDKGNNGITRANLLTR